MRKIIKLLRKITQEIIRGKYRSRYGSVGKNVVLLTNMKNISRPENIFLGNYVSLGSDIVMYATNQSKIVIGDGSIIAPRCKLITSNHKYDGADLKSIPFDNVNIVQDIIIGKGVWIGDSVLVLPGITIGRGAVIGGGSVVTKDIPDYAIAAGNPARVLKYRDASTFDKLLDEKKFYRSIDWTSHGGKEFIRKE